MRIIPENPGNEYRTAYLYEKKIKKYIICYMGILMLICISIFVLIYFINKN